MPMYIVNTQPQANGDHEVHKSDCNHRPQPHNSRFLGFFETCRAAVDEAKKIYLQSNGCFYCSRECHTS